MPLYVLALTDTPPEPSPEPTLHVESTGGVHAVCQRRTKAPRPTEDELRAQHALVLEIAARAGAILPVRFGTLLTKAELTRAVRDHQQEIQAAFDRVRGRVQMTIRVTGRRRPEPKGAPATGRGYLERKRRQALPPLPASAAAFLKALAPLAAAERRAPGAGPLLATVYHLVNSKDLSRYARIADAAPASVAVTGPWPPFAFTPSFA